MAAPFRCDEKVTIEHDIGVGEDAYGKKAEDWQPLLADYWANVQDVLPSRAEVTKNGLGQAVQRTRLRMRKNAAVSMTMRVVLHGRGNQVMQIIAGPAQLDDRVHEEWMLEGYATKG